MGGRPERGLAGGPCLSSVKGSELSVALRGSHAFPARGPCLPLAWAAWPRPVPSGCWLHVPLGWELEVSGGGEGLIWQSLP